MTGEEFHQTVAAHQGDVVLVDMWATWCAPCRERFPHIVEMSRELADEGLTVISLSVDDVGEEAAVREFLREQDARFENLLGVYGLGTESTEAFDYSGEVPFYKLYDRSGELRYEFSGDADREGIEPVDSLEERVRELLSEPSPGAGAGAQSAASPTNDHSLRAGQTPCRFASGTCAIS